MVAEARAAVVVGLPVIRGKVETGRQCQAIDLVVVAVTGRQRQVSHLVVVAVTGRQRQAIDLVVVAVTGRQKVARSKSLLVGQATQMLNIISSNKPLTRGSKPTSKTLCAAQLKLWANYMNDQGKNKIEFLIGFLDKAWQWVANAAGILSILAGIGLFCFQVFAYLKHGEWIEVPLSMLASFVSEEFVSWLNNPTSWFGLHKIINGALELIHPALELIPLALFAIVVGGAIVDYDA